MLDNALINFLLLFYNYNIYMLKKINILLLFVELVSLSFFSPIVSHCFNVGNRNEAGLVHQLVNFVHVFLNVGVEQFQSLVSLRQPHSFHLESCLKQILIHSFQRSRHAEHHCLKYQIKLRLIVLVNSAFIARAHRLHG